MLPQSQHLEETRTPIEQRGREFDLELAYDYCVFAIDDIEINGQTLQLVTGIGR